MEMERLHMKSASVQVLQISCPKPPMELCVIKGQKNFTEVPGICFVGPTLFKPHVFNIGREHTVGKTFMGTSCISDVLYFTKNQPEI